MAAGTRLPAQWPGGQPPSFTLPTFPEEKRECRWASRHASTLVAPLSAALPGPSPQGCEGGGWQACGVPAPGGAGGQGHHLAPGVPPPPSPPLSLIRTAGHPSSPGKAGFSLSQMSSQPQARGDPGSGSLQIRVSEDAHTLPPSLSRRVCERADVRLSVLSRAGEGAGEGGGSPRGRGTGCRPVQVAEGGGRKPASVAPRGVVSWGESVVQEDAHILPQVMAALGNTGTRTQLRKRCALENAELEDVNRTSEPVHDGEGSVPLILEDSSGHV